MGKRERRVAPEGTTARPCHHLLVQHMQHERLLTRARELGGADDTRGSVAGREVAPIGVVGLMTAERGVEDAHQP